MRRPFSLQDPLNRRFLDNTFEILNFLASEHESEISRSRVLGVPAALHSLILRIACGPYSGQELQDSCYESNLRESVQQWHECLTTISDGTNSSSPSMTDLYILAASLLYDLHDHDRSLVVMDYAKRVNVPDFTKLPLRSVEEPSIGTRWQVELALAYLRHPNLRQVCVVCYLSAWPLFIFGSVVDKPEDIDFIRQLLRDSQEVTGYGELGRIEHELEQGWLRADPISAMSSSTCGTVEGLQHSSLRYSGLT
ncbi:hypothetical protein LTR84_006874 [Exophiala bonariae]|uniref:Transcription factor domain-containing protein n=1 Tax=Exophiala bonariae TaxID=1690606 RepID=A0AAV9N077_9EURO|nr:hypothetical protein LTR84_006874 [Exophiala bonariae]